MAREDDRAASSNNGSTHSHPLVVTAIVLSAVAFLLAFTLLVVRRTDDSRCPSTCCCSNGSGENGAGGGDGAELVDGNAPRLHTPEMHGDVVGSPDLSAQSDPAPDPGPEKLTRVSGKWFGVIHTPASNGIGGPTQTFSFQIQLDGVVHSVLFDGAPAPNGTAVAQPDVGGHGVVKIAFGGTAPTLSTVVVAPWNPMIVGQRMLYVDNRGRFACLTRIAIDDPACPTNFVAAQIEDAWEGHRVSFAPNLSVLAIVPGVGVTIGTGGWNGGPPGLTVSSPIQLHDVCRGHFAGGPYIPATTGNPLPGWVHTILSLDPNFMAGVFCVDRVTWPNEMVFMFLTRVNS